MSDKQKAANTKEAVKLIDRGEQGYNAAHGRFTSHLADLLAVGSRRRLADWCARRVIREGLTPAERAWWQELAGALSAPAPPRDS